MADEGEGTAKAQTEAMLEEAEADIAEAEALAAAARARARAARLRQTLSEREPEADEEYEYYYVDEHGEPIDYDEGESEDGDYDEDGEYEEEPDASSLLGRIRLFLPRIAKVAAVILILGFAGLSAYMTLEHNQSKDRQKRSDAFANGARQGVINMTSLDFNKAKDDIQRVIDGSTGEFRADFQRRAEDLTKSVEQSKAVTEGMVNATAVESMDEHSALVLVSATSRITNSPDPKAESRMWRLRVTVIEDGGQYKMSKVEFVP